MTTNSYFEIDKNVEAYLKMTNGYDGAELISKLEKYLNKAATILELGMGPGKDLDILRRNFQATGSDYSDVFIKKYNKINPGTDVLKLDAVTLKTDRKFECIYSNKVLHHLTTEDLKASIARQKELLLPNGILFHSFWAGDKEENYDGLRFIYYTKEKLIDYFSKDFELVDVQNYKEFEKDDSIYIIVKNN